MTEQNASSPPRKQTADELVWAHATSPSRHAVLVDIARRLTHLRPTARVLITHEPNAITGPLAEVDNVTFESLPKDTSTEARAFLQEHKPDLCIWTGGHLRQQILKNTAQADIPSLLIDADEDGFAAVRRTWFYNPTRASLRMFSAILANGPNAAAALTRLGAPVDRITLTGQLKESQSPLQCSESDLDELNAGLSGRPVWLACYVQRDEVEPILNAHRKATRLSHRLLLVISMDKEEDINDARIAMGGSGFRWARWAPGQPVDDNTQVVL
ncbi:MAG: glycosyltransferase N-terminal domain-containing protein, partial [Pseudomonadota bacterium]